MNELIDQSTYIPLIIPTVLIPFTLLSVGISVVATFIAGLFGIKLKAEGPKQLLEVLLKPRILISALALNLVFYGGFKAYKYVKNLPRFQMVINRKHQPVISKFTKYPDQTQRINRGTSMGIKTPNKISVKQLWVKKLKAGSFRNPTLSGESMFLSSLDGNIYELSVASGKELRKFFIGTPIVPAPVIYQGKMYSGEGTHYTHHARIYKVDLKSGKHEGSYEAKGHNEGQPVIATYNNRALMFVVSGKDGLHAVDPKTMKLVWRINFGHIDAAVRVENGVVYIGTGREKGDAKKYKTFVAALDFNTGKTIWKNETPMSSWMEPAITKDYACFILGEIYFKTKMGGLTCFDKKTGAPQFTVTNDAPQIGVPFVLNNDVIVSDFKGKVCRIDIKNRRTSWCSKTKAKGKNMTAVSFDPIHNVLLYTTSSEGLFFLDPNTGKKIHQFKPDKKMVEWTFTYADALAVSDGVILVDKAGNVRKLKIMSDLGDLAFLSK